MTTPANYKQVKRLFNGLSDSLKKYLWHFPKLIDADLPFEITVAYLFQCVERAHRRALYCSIVKKYAANSEFTDKIIQKERLTRASFDALFKRVFGAEIPSTTKQLLTDAEGIRDTAMHGGVVDDPKLRRAIQDIIKYLEEFNAFVLSRGDFEPCGDLRGFKGRAENIDKETTRWILKGMGLSLK